MFLFEIFAAVWFFALGAVIGSFLNVVVWRTPRGESIVGPSRCPQCRTAIRWYNNVPVFGWIWLGGKCRDCRLPISPRYPIVEFLCGSMFLAVALAELADRGFANVMLDANWPLVRVYAMHMLLLCSLLAWALMQVDEQRVPVSQIAGLWLFGIAWACLHWSIGGSTSQLWQQPLRLVAGFALGAVLAGPLALLSRASATGESQWAIVAAMASIGLLLGPEAVLVVAALATGLRTVSWLLGMVISPLKRGPVTMDIFVAAVVQICCWKWLAFTLWP